MDLFTLLKIGISKLSVKIDLSKLFNGWFSHNKTEIHYHYHKTTIEIKLPSYPKPPILRDPVDIERPELQNRQIKILLSENQMELINKMNQVYRINGKANYNFLEDYGWILYYMQNKPDNNWYYNVASQIAWVMQGIDFWGAFEEIDDPERKDQFNNIKHKINYLYRIIQDLRSTNKRGKIEKQFRAPYHNILEKKPELKDSDYEDIFNKFQNLLIELFNNFKLKQ